MFKKIAYIFIFGFIISASLPLVADDLKNNPYYNAAQAFIKRYSCDDLESCKKLLTVENIRESQEFTRDNQIIKEFFVQVRAGNSDANNALDYCRVEFSKKITALSNTSTTVTWKDQVLTWSPWVAGIIALGCALQFENVPVGVLSLTVLGYQGYQTAKNAIKNAKDDAICFTAQHQMKNRIELLNHQQLLPASSNQLEKK